VIAPRPFGWARAGLLKSFKRRSRSPLDLSDRNQSQVRRFELRLGSKQLRNRFEMRNWQDFTI
jgi:hypothetical protein